MITGDQFRHARIRRGYTREQAATVLDKHLQTIARWERGHVPASEEREVIDKIMSGDPLSTVDDFAFVAELIRRMKAANDVTGDVVGDERSDVDLSVVPDLDLAAELLDRLNRASKAVQGRPGHLVAPVPPALRERPRTVPQTATPTERQGIADV